MWVLGREPGSSGRLSGALKHRAISSALNMEFWSYLPVTHQTVFMSSYIHWSCKVYLTPLMAFRAESTCSLLHHFWNLTVTYKKHPGWKQKSILWPCYLLQSWRSGRGPLLMLEFQGRKDAFAKGSDFTWAVITAITVAWKGWEGLALVPSYLVCISCFNLLVRFLLKRQGWGRTVLACQHQLWCYSCPLCIISVSLPRQDILAILEFIIF